ncbi:MAG: hypothetical protein IT165_32845 [Bryobacterales bacterium]|nr:hypothetical protein [Bryobacterales bacterium]
MRLRVAFLSFLATYLFFYEYLPPWKTVHLFSDIEGYHYPLYNYAQKAFHEGRFPEWDVAEYSGISFVGNPQAAVLYPPNWLVYFANRMHDGVRFQTLEDLEFLHYWAAFLLAWLWLRGWTRTEVPALAGAAVFAFGGYRMAESQHLGVMCGYSWYPLGLWGLDEAVKQKRWAPLWKTAVASALCLTAGYPPTWFVFCVCCVVYAAAIAPWRETWRPVAAIAFSLLLAMAQLAPVLEAAGMKAKEKVYGAGLPGGAFFCLQFLLPNYYDQARSVGHLGPPQESYLYLGAAALLGCGWLIWRRRWKTMLPAAALLGACMLFITNPGRIFEIIIGSLPVVSEACREWNFLAVFGLAAAMLAALGLDDLARAGRRFAWWIPAAAALLWNARQWWVWRGGGHFATGWWTTLEAALTVLVLCLLFLAPQRVLVQAAILAAIWIEFKVYGTSRRFNASTGSVDRMFAQDGRTGGPEMLGMNAAVYEQMRRDVDYRVALDSGPHGTELRFYRLATPAGFDPFLTAQYRRAVERFVSFHREREFIFDWSNAQMMDAFAVKYVITTPDAGGYAKLASDSRFRLMQPAEGYYRVFKYLAARPSFRFDAGKAQRVRWLPEERLYRVNSKTGGQFHLLEQFFPGSKAYVDGQQAPVTRVRTTFQGIGVPSGEHWVEFRFRSVGMRIGAVVSLLSWLGMFLAVVRARSRTPAPPARVS